MPRKLKKSEKEVRDDRRWADDPKRCVNDSQQKVGRGLEGDDARCGRKPMEEQRTCYMHGGRTGVALRKVEKVKAERRLHATIGELMEAEERSYDGKIPDIKDQVVINVNRTFFKICALERVLASLSVTASSVADFEKDDSGSVTAVVGLPIDEHGMIVSGGTGGWVLHPLEKHLSDLKRLHTSMVKDAVTLGIEQEKLDMQQAYAGKLDDFLKKVIDTMGATPEQIAKLPDIIDQLADYFE